MNRISIPVDLNARIHQFIISGEFRAWRKRTAETAPPPVPRAANGRRLLPCTYPGCTNTYQRNPHKPNTYCLKHAIQLWTERRKQASATPRAPRTAPCAQPGCETQIHLDRNKTGYCIKHVPRKGVKKKKNRQRLPRAKSKGR